MDCGPACLRMVAGYYGKKFSLQYLREKCYIDREGVSLKGISEAAEHIGFRTMAVKIPFFAASDEPSLRLAPLPLVAHWEQKHFIVVYRINRRFVWVADPAAGKIKLPIEQFKRSWLSDQDKGIALLLEPGLLFFETAGERRTPKLTLGYFFRNYLRPHNRLMANLLLGVMLMALFQLLFPFLTQSIVDVGIDNRNIGFIWLVLIGQLMLFFGQTVVGLIQSWTYLHLGTRVGVNLTQDFLHKLTRLPIGFFDAKFTGDLLQRIGDQRRIENFLTQSVFNIVLAAVNLIVFALLLIWYYPPVFFLFLISTLLYFTWILYFLKKRKEVDYMGFQKMSDSQSNLIEIIQGMPEVKLQGSQRKRRWAWTTIQAKLFRIQMKSLAITQWQESGAQFIHQLKDILITFLSAKAVIEGELTLGMMLAIQYMVGRLNAPLQQMMGFIRSAQDASISLERLSEVHEQPDEEPGDEPKQPFIPKGDIQLQNVSFQYTPISGNVLENINLTIPRGKVTAIVGTSGSGKTTLIKLLLGFYKPTSGRIKVGEVPLDALSLSEWRGSCGVVMQDGYIFSDTISNNIAESDEQANLSRVWDAAQTSNILQFIESLPLGFNTMIGSKGNGISQGQKQRLLIARAVYKNPEIIFLDEATNALDAENERIILKNLDDFFIDKTVIIIAHRLSTVRHADNIIVLEKGCMIETGNHEQLVRKKGTYFSLVKNQLELGV